MANETENLIASGAVAPVAPQAHADRRRGREVRRLLADLGLATVCSGAHCPNLSECFARGTATFLILGRAVHAVVPVLRDRARAAGPLRDG